MDYEIVEGLNARFTCSVDANPGVHQVSVGSNDHCLLLLHTSLILM